jgi:hypothetical protein
MAEAAAELRDGDHLQGQILFESTARNVTCRTAPSTRGAQEGRDTGLRTLPGGLCWPSAVTTIIPEL